jgi:hypothetical protein
MVSRRRYTNRMPPPRRHGFSGQLRIIARSVVLRQENPQMYWIPRAGRAPTAARRNGLGQPANLCSPKTGGYRSPVGSGEPGGQAVHESSPCAARKIAATPCCIEDCRFFAVSHSGLFTPVENVVDSSFASPQSLSWLQMQRFSPRRGHRAAKCEMSACTPISSAQKSRNRLSRAHLRKSRRKLSTRGASRLWNCA